MTSKQFRAAKRERQRNAVMNRGPRGHSRGDGGHIPENLLEPIRVDRFTADRLSRERAGILARLRALDLYDESRVELERAAFWVEQRLLGQCA